ncbi:hypothetical protein GCM10027169_24230 [Gordonia jinhuaensis]
MPNTGGRFWSRSPESDSATSASTTDSNGTSAWAKASRSAVRTDERRSAKLAAGSTCVRRGTVETNIPTSPDSAGSSCAETAVPITTSVAPDSRATVAASAACMTMNGVVAVPESAPNDVAAVRTSGAIRAETVSARKVGWAGRGWSVSSECSRGASRSPATTSATPRRAGESGSSRSPSVAR